MLENYQSSKLESTEYSTLPSPPRLMQQTHTQCDSVTAAAKVSLFNSAFYN